MDTKIKKIFSPISLPIIFFGLAILIGTILLHCPFSYQGNAISWLDSFFTATSATCVTGLTVVDTGSSFSTTGQTIIIILVQIGGLGIMSFASLTFYLLRNRVSLTDRITVGQNLLPDPSFNLGKFLIQIVVVTLFIEISGALFLYFLDSLNFSPFSAIFHSISAFCNAGFSLNSDSLMIVKENWSINLVIIILIILGGLGFSVIIEGKSHIVSVMKGITTTRKISWHFKIVVKTSLFLVVAGCLYIYFCEFIGFKRNLPWYDALLTSLFQSVTSRTAGFNTLDIANMTNVSLLFMIFLMFIGGAPGSCAGGIKVTTLRVLWAFIVSKIKGKQQVVIGKYAVDEESINKSFTLLFFSLMLICVCILLLDFSEGGEVPHLQARGQFVEILFEAVSAFGTVGLSTGLTTKLSPFGKIIIILLMFAGRLGPLVLLSALQSLQTKILYSRPKEKLFIG